MFRGCGFCSSSTMWHCSNTDNAYHVALQQHGQCLFDRLLLFDRLIEPRGDDKKARERERQSRLTTITITITSTVSTLSSLQRSAPILPLFTRWALRSSVGELDSQLDTLLLKYVDKNHSRHVAGDLP